MKEDILRQISTIARALDSIANIEFKEMQLNRGQYLYLVRIKENPGIISDHLAGMLNVDRTTTARSIKKLEDNGLIERKNDQQNKKIKHLFVTKKGDELAEKIGKNNNINLTFTGSLAQLGRVLNPVITQDNKRIGTRRITGGVNA